MRLILALVMTAAITLSANANEPTKELQILTPFIGTWKTVDGTVAGGQPFEDVSKWEWAFGGKILKITHSVNQGAYYGETLVSWDAQQQAIIYRYVNNWGFYTDGTITRAGESIDVHEYVRGATSGPTETQSTMFINDSGQMVVETKMKMNDAWGEATKRVPTGRRCNRYFQGLIPCDNSPHWLRYAASLHSPHGLAVRA